MCSHTDEISSFQEREMERRDTGLAGMTARDHANAKPQPSRGAAISASFAASNPREDPPAPSPASIAPPCTRDISSTSTSRLSGESFAESASYWSEESVADADEVTSGENEGEDTSNTDEKSDLVRCSSESSMVTSEHVSKANKGSSNERSTCFRTDEEEFLQTLGSSQSGWTDDKHSSYLNSMEANFVRNMFDREYCALDVCGQAAQHTDSSEIDCAESQPRALYDGAASSPAEFKAWQHGCWQPVAFNRPVLGPVLSSAAVLRSPWIKHFRPSTGSGSASETSISCSPPMIEDQKDSKRIRSPRRVVDEPPAEVVPEVEKGVRAWQERLQSQFVIAGSHRAKIKPGVMKPLKRDTSPLIEGVCKRLRGKQQLDRQRESGIMCNQDSAKNCKRLPTESPIPCVQLEEEGQESNWVTIPLSNNKRGVVERGHAAERLLKITTTDKECQRIDQVVPHICGASGAEGTPDSVEEKHHPMLVLSSGDSS